MILRYFKANDENVEALETPYIFLFNAKQWKDQSELQFEIDISDPVQLRQFVDEVITQQMALPKGSTEYNEYFALRFNLLNEEGKAEVLSGTTKEKGEVVDLLTKKILADPKLQNRKGLIRSNFFTRTGICCFTSDKTSLTKSYHWDVFTLGGNGFCVEYDWRVLMKHFESSNAGIRGEKVSYYFQRNKPKLILSSSFSQRVIDNYCEIIFSLREDMQQEHEFRLAKVYKHDIEDKDELRKQIIPAEAIKSVIFGAHITSSSRNRIEIIVKERLPGVQLKQMKISDSKYAIEET